MVRIHKQTNQRKELNLAKLRQWRISHRTKNVSRITANPHQNVHLENFPSVRFQHFTGMMKDKDFPAAGKCSKYIG